jgi:hypothetical protein
LIRQAEYQPTWHEPSNAYTAPNRANGIRLAFDTGGVQVRASDPAENWALELTLTGYGAAGAIEPVAGEPALAVDGSRVTYRWSDTLSEWYVNDERGLEQGFTIAAPPAGEQIVLEMALETDLVPQLAADAQSVSFRRPDRDSWQAGGDVLRYDSLHVSDATGRQVPAHMHLSGCAGSATYRLHLLVDAASAVYPLTVDPILHSQIAKLTPSDAENDDWFGNSVAISGDTVVVGAYLKDGAGISRGAAYIFDRNAGGADAWGQVIKLTASDAEDHDNFGDAVAISNDTVVISADDEDGAGSARGAAYVFDRNAGGINNWGEVTKLTASDAEDLDHFGTSVSISGDTIIIGADLEDGSGTDRGAAYVFDRDNGGTDNWGEVGKLTASNATDGGIFGGSVSISGDTAVVGAELEDGAGTDRGAAYVFDRNSGGADNWGEVAELTASDAQEDDWFGRFVAISGDTVVVGAYREDGAGTNRGAAYVFDRDNGGTDAWGEVAKLTAADAEDHDNFGTSAAISGNTVVIGASGEDGAGTYRGAAYIFERNTGGADNWGQLTKLTASDTADLDLFGNSVAISSDTIVVGAYRKAGAGANRGAAYVFDRDNGGTDAWGEVAKLTPSDAADDDGFGYSVAISGDTIVVGAYQEDGAGTDHGAAYVFDRNVNGADAWGQVTKLAASDGADDDEFGYSVAISGDTVVVSTPDEDGAGTDRGAAYVYTRNTGGADAWGEAAKLTASDAADDDWFGYSIAISGDAVVVGAPGEDGLGTARGAAYVFERNTGGADAWGQVAKLTASDTEDGDSLGWSVAISSNTVVVGASYENGAGVNRGAAYVFERNTGGADNWGEVAKLTASDAADGDLFGYSVAISGDTAVVGASFKDGVGTNRGAAYVFERNAGGADAWGEVAKLTASDAADTDVFGGSVAISSDTVVVGAHREDGAGTNRGAAYVFERNAGGTDNWGQVDKLTASDAEDGDWFGLSVSISGATVVVGARYEDGAGTDRGAAYTFVHHGDTWQQIARPTASDAANDDRFGSSVAISGDAVVVGVPYEDGAGNGRGAAYVYTRNTGGTDSWGEVIKLTASDAADDDGFGWSVAISGDTVIVGAPGEDGAGTDRGAAYVFERNTGGADAWGEVVRLSASDAADSDKFGQSVAISSDTAVVGAELEDGAGTDRGAAYVFERNTGGADAWGEVAKLTASDAEDEDRFGASVAISGDTAIVGAYREDGAGIDYGAAYVFERNTGGADAWGEVTKLAASDAADSDVLGVSVAISGDTAVVGASLEDGRGSDRGAAYVFERNTGGGDAWGEIAKLIAFDTEDGDTLGTSVAISGDTVVVGADGEDGRGTDRGAAYVFERNTDGADHWGQVEKLTAFDAADGDEFGVSVAVSGDTIVVGARYEDGAGTDRGAAYVFAAEPYVIYLPLVLQS